MHLQPTEWNPGLHSVVPHHTNMKIVDTPNGFPEGYTMVKSGHGLGVLDHYEPGKVPQHVVTKDAIGRASQRAEIQNQFRKEKSKRRSSSS